MADRIPVPSAGCIRFYPANHATPGPRWHIDAQHQPFGIMDTSEPPTIDAEGLLVIKLVGDGPDGENILPVGAMKADSDETLTARGISGGCSNGGPICRVQFYKDGVNGADGAPLDLNNPVHWSRISGNFCNVWMTLSHSKPALTPPEQ